MMHSLGGPAQAACVHLLAAAAAADDVAAAAAASACSHLQCRHHQTCCRRWTLATAAELPFGWQAVSQQIDISSEQQLAL